MAVEALRERLEKECGKKIEGFNNDSEVVLDPTKALSLLNQF